MAKHAELFDLPEAPAKSSRAMMQDHGTKAFALKPSSLIGAAVADLKTKETNKADDTKDRGTRWYTFHRTHVRKAKSAVELLSIALADLARGASSAKPNTRLIYADKKLLSAALRKAKRKDRNGVSAKA